MLTEVDALVTDAILCVVSASLILLIPIRASVRRRTPSTADWPSVPGVVTVCKRLEGNEHIGRRPSTKLRYEYEVNGVRHRGSRIRLMDLRSDLEWAWAKYPVGHVVPVHYDPRRVDFAILEPGTSGDYFGRGIVGETLFWFSELLLGVFAALCCWFTCDQIFGG